MLLILDIDVCLITNGKCFDCVIALQEIVSDKWDDDEDWVKVEDVMEPQSAYDIELDEELLLRSFSGVTETNSVLSILNNLCADKLGFII